MTQRDLMLAAVQEVFDGFILQILGSSYPKGISLDPAEVAENVQERLRRNYARNQGLGFNNTFIRRSVQFAILDLLRKRGIEIQVSQKATDGEGDARIIEAPDPSEDTEGRVLQWITTKELSVEIFVRNEAGLTKTEIKVLTRFREGKSTETVAIELYGEATKDTLNTVGAHKSNAKRKIRDYIGRRNT